MQHRFQISERERDREREHTQWEESREKKLHKPQSRTISSQTPENFLFINTIFDLPCKRTRHGKGRLIDRAIENILQFCKLYVYSFLLHISQTIGSLCPRFASTNRIFTVYAATIEHSFPPMNNQESN